jgi:hypothetical protein
MTAPSQHTDDRTGCGFGADDVGERARARSDQMATHVKVLAGIHLFLAGGLVLLAIGIAAALGGAGLLSGDLQAIVVTSGVASLVGGILVAIAAPGLLAGFGLLGHRRWARVLALIIAVVHLPGLPFGTLFGVYSFWVLLHDDAVPLFRRNEVY